MGGVFEHLALRGGVQEVRVHAENGASPRLSFGDGDLVRLGEFEEFGAACQVPFPPRGDHLDGRVERIGGFSSKRT